MEEFLGPRAEYNEEEEERKYYRRKRLGVIKNVLAASVGAMIVYSVYMGESARRQKICRSMFFGISSFIGISSCKLRVWGCFRSFADAAAPPL